MTTKKKPSRKITEEGITQYLAKRAARVAKKLEDQTMWSAYNNQSYPDNNLHQKFLWRKKIERDVAKGVPLHQLFSVKAEKKRQRERMEEIDKVKRRREAKVLEKEQREKQREVLARERAWAEFQDWEKKEEEFIFNRSKIRSEIRLRQGRTKPIDDLSKYLNGLDDSDVGIEIIEPYKIFEGLIIREMEELHDAIELNLAAARVSQMHMEYWKALLTVCNWELAEAWRKDAMDRARVCGDEPPKELLFEGRGLHSIFQAEVWNLLEGKTSSELEALESKIELEMISGAEKVVEYWEAVLKWLQIYKAKAYLKETHGHISHQHMQQLKPHSKLVSILQPNTKDVATFSSDSIMKEEKPDTEEKAGSFSPQLLCGDDSAEEAIGPEEDRTILERRLKAALEERKKRIQEAMASKPPSLEENFEVNSIKAMQAMEEGDVVIGSTAEVILNSEVEWWHDKYQPRKPKHFNRVHTGYEWNKYNRTHYDHENPPPKIVQGYKFNIFYPDLINKTQAPTYTLENEGNNDETCIIRFHAGPPYEDIAFRIVNKDWDKKGLKQTFDGRILQVHFNLKRYRYCR